MLHYTVEGHWPDSPVPSPIILTPLRTEHLHGRWFRLTEPFVFYSAELDKTILCPVHFVTDFASVPRLPLAHMLTANTEHAAAVIHDMGYRWAFVSRWRADMLFLEVAGASSVIHPNQNMLWRFGRSMRRGVMTTFVVTFGWVAYKRMPGCLDYRACKKWMTCDTCSFHYARWEDCIHDGYVPDLALADSAGRYYHTQPEERTGGRR